MVTRKLLLTGMAAFASATVLSQSALADSREDIEARIQALNTELYQLRQQLQQIEAPEEAARGVEPEPLPVEAALEDLSERRQLEQESSRNPFSITTHRTNYLFPISYNSNQNVEPTPSWLSKPIRPPINSTNCLQIANPSPVPPYCRDVELSACVKLLNRRPCASSLMPTPLSWTSNRI